MKQDLKIESTVNNFKSVLEKNGNSIDFKQIKFAEDVAKLMYEVNNQKINVITARCGFGKSVFIRAFLDNLVNNKNFWGSEPSRETTLESEGAILVTDSLKRLDETMVSDGLNDRIYFMRYDKEDTINNNKIDFDRQLIEQFNYPILLITTQKYFKMTQAERKQILKWRKGLREICIIDEKPSFFSDIVIDEPFLSNIKIALHKLDESDDEKRCNKNYLLKTFENVYQELNDIRNTYSNTYEEMWIKKSKNSLLLTVEEDKMFFEKLKSSDISNNSYDDILDLKRVYTEGCLFTSKKDKKQQNIRQFIILNDNISKFIDECRYFIFDATAKVDVDYSIFSDRINFVDIDDKKDIMDITLNHIPFNSSKNKLQHVKNIELISSWINKNFKSDEVFLATYSDKNKVKILSKIKACCSINDENIVYFGDIKGKNNWEDKIKMIHLGLNRTSDIPYFLTYLHLTKKYLEWNNCENNEQINNEIIDIISLESKSSLFLNNEMAEIMKSKIIVDTQQNMFRIKCRHFSNRDMCDIYIVAGEMYQDYIKEIAKNINANLVTYNPIEFDIYEILSRTKEDGTESNAQKITNWIANIWNGNEIGIKSMLEQIGITQNQFNDAKKENKKLSRVLKTYMIKRGIYQKNNSNIDNRNIA